MTVPALPADRASPAPRCGLVAIVGRPNVGKSTLLNALVGQKVSITSRKAQTTRHRITGIRTLGESQFVFVDTPGFQTQHGAALNRTLNRTVKGVLADVDVVLFVVEAGRFTLDDAKVLALMPAPGKGARPVILVANKLDAVRRRAELAPWLRGMQERYPFAEFVPLCARKAADAQLAQSQTVLDAAENSYRIARLRYDGGLETYLDVLTVENALVARRRAVSGLRARAFAADVELIRALGGGYGAGASKI